MKLLYAVMYLAAVPAAARASTYYTAKTGSDQSSCEQARSEATPKLTINGGVGCLSAGDTLIVKPGTYTDVVIWYNHRNRRSGTAGNPITVRSEMPRAAIIKPGAAGNGKGLGGSTEIVGFENQSYWTFDGF